MDHPAAGEEESVLAVLLDEDPEVGRAVFSGLGAGSLDQNIVEGHLLVGHRVFLRLAVDRLVVLSVLGVVGQRGFCDREAVSHIQVHRAHRITILLERVALLREGEVLLVVVSSSVLRLEARFPDGFFDVLRVSVSSVLRPAAGGNSVEAAVIRTEDTANAVDVIDVFSGEDVLSVVDRSAVVDDNGIPLQCLVDKICPDAADVADPLKVLPVLDNSHLAAHAALFDDLIEDIDVAQAVLGLRFFVDREHDRDRSLSGQRRVDGLSGQNADIRVFLCGRAAFAGFGLLIITSLRCGSRYSKAGSCYSHAHSHK